MGNLLFQNPRSSYSIYDIYDYNYEENENDENNNVNEEINEDINEENDIYENQRIIYRRRREILKKTKINKIKIEFNINNDYIK